MDKETQTELSKKAPLLEPEEVLDLIENKLLSDGTRDQADGIWLYGSMVNPEKKLDKGENYSDLDIFVIVPEWNLPLVGPSAVIYAPQVETPLDEAFQWGNKEWKFEHEWGSAERAYELLPEHARTTFMNCTRQYFIAKKEDQENNIIRQFELRIGNEEHRKYFDFLKHGRDL